jgi:hypothetical protein
MRSCHVRETNLERVAAVTWSVQPGRIERHPSPQTGAGVPRLDQRRQQCSPPAPVNWPPAMAPLPHASPTAPQQPCAHNGQPADPSSAQLRQSSKVLPALRCTIDRATSASQDITDAAAAAAAVGGLRLRAARAAINPLTSRLIHQRLLRGDLAPDLAHPLLPLLLDARRLADVALLGVHARLGRGDLRYQRFEGLRTKLLAAVGAQPRPLVGAVTAVCSGGRASSQHGHGGAWAAVCGSAVWMPCAVRPVSSAGSGSAHAAAVSELRCAEAALPTAHAVVHQGGVEHQGGVAHVPAVELAVWAS